MSTRIVSRRLAPSARSQLYAATAVAAKSLPVTVGAGAQKRHKWSLNPFKGWGRKKLELDEDFNSLDDPKLRKKFLENKMQSKTDDNIFQDEIQAAKKAKNIADLKRNTAAPIVEKTPENTAMALDPEPLHRIRWQRRKVIQMVQRNGKMTKEEKLKMTERQITHKSPFMATSVKKLTLLARQIAGKTVDDAITQMTWSKKKMAAEVKYYLEEARDMAIVERGMGLGKVNGDLYAKPKRIKTKDGKWMDVSDPSRLYVSQSWVGRGTLRGKELDYKGCGRAGIIQHRSTSLSVLLKEERTRVREHEEREAAKAAERPWVHLPNRSIHGQRPYYTW